MSFFQRSSTTNPEEDFFDKSQTVAKDFFSTSLQRVSTFFPTTQNALTTQYFNENFIDSQSQSTQAFENSFPYVSSKSVELNTQYSIRSNHSDSIFSDAEDGSSEDSSNKTVNDTSLGSPSYSPPNSPKKTQIFNLTMNATHHGDASNLPDSIKNLYLRIKEEYSDFTFTSIIAGQLCSNMFPMGAYSNLKLSLLMSLVASSKLHIMAIGQEISHASILMNCIGKHAKRFLRVTSNFDGVTVNNTNNQIIEAGGIMLASNGIAFLGNWQRIPQKAALKMLREIETRTILVDKIQKNYPLETTIWAYWNFTAKIKKDLASISQFINVFGFPIIIDDENFVEEIIDDLLNQVLTEPYDRTNDFQIPEKDFQLYMDYVQNLTVEFDQHAEDMINKYFIATKIIRSGALSEKGYETLKNMAESHAKLSLRKIVTQQDVLVAISIAEKFIKEFFDHDAYTSPTLDLSVGSIDCCDKFMSDLHQWNISFTKDILEKL